MKKPKLLKLPGIQAGIAGEYLVAAELTRRGYVASLTLRNTRGIDILTSNSEATKSVGIQVKTSQGAQPRWMMSKKAEKEVAENLFYVFVCLVPHAAPTFHVAPRHVVAKYITKSHRRWLKIPGKHGQKHRDSSLRSFRDTEHKYKDRWELLGLG